MPLTLQWGDIAVRLALTIIAGTLVGIDRSERGQAAGLRTTILVCLAAAVAMIQMNLLLPLGGRTSDSFASLDLMRLPLGILTGVGFIGGGAILRRGNMIQGVTTAATLWIVTVIGLCLGGGQLALGMTTLAIGLDCPLGNEVAGIPDPPGTPCDAQRECQSRGTDRSRHPGSAVAGRIRDQILGR